VLAGAPVIVTDDIEAAADLIRPGIALYIGGMGAKEVTSTPGSTSGWATKPRSPMIQDLYLAGHKAEATAASPHSADRGDGAIGRWPSFATISRPGRSPSSTC